ncbi:uncharacterized protein HMPREF1541_01275 [Cyphellophora europaea CBS 101466]|uniref:WSC domain-containing protein n=1 Tax=Cyphellophora europaea (strain CBS 101466) TaxID=1220924 RepID=W2SEN1_CYPE1|nr:uncharacterized protein HMPREF1541_01275 [Cyphellophora europaea CBS 101466]ETN47085.1 hypothetical protein HMPREF1541_01275 [Cyphellophora europaea CBS 101466]
MSRRSFLYLALLAPVTTFAATLSARTDSPDLPIADPLPAGWSYSGCFVDSVSSRSLDSAFLQDDDQMTGVECMQFCASNGYPYAGIEYMQECYCGTAQPTNGPTTGCNMGCRGNASEACGGQDRITVYENPGLTPHVYPGDSCWKPQGCYTDSTNARTFERRVASGDGDVQTCLNQCKGQGFSWTGLEYGSECWCGNALAITAQSTTDGCDMTCQNAPSEYCGGKDSLNAYQLDSSCSAGIITTTTSSTTTTTTTSPTTTTATSDTITTTITSDTTTTTEITPTTPSTTTTTTTTTPSITTTTTTSPTTTTTTTSSTTTTTTITTTTTPSIITTTTLTKPPTTTTTTKPSTTTTPNAQWSGVPSMPGTTSKSPSAITTTITMKSTTKATTSSISTKPSTTSCTTTFKTSIKPIPSSTCKPTLPSSLITNGGFETGLSPWLTSSSSATGYICNKTGAYEGCSIFIITPSSSSSTSHTYTLTSNASIPPTTTTALSLTLYIGRRTASIPPVSNPTITVSISGTSWSKSFTACSGSSCNLSGANGTVWKKVTANVSLPPPASRAASKNAAALVITVSWPSTTVGKCNSKGYGEDDVLIDGVGFA